MKLQNALLGCGIALCALVVHALADIPNGTIVPVALNSSISAKDARVGQTISTSVMQDVPLPNGMRIREGAKIIGGLREVQPASEGTPAKISFSLTNYVSKEGIRPVRTSLRAIASFVEVESAQVPTTNANNTTLQVGGDDVVYRGGGLVVNATNGPVGGPAGITGVLVRTAVTPGSPCHDDPGETQGPQALWVFSSTACGVYGLNATTITKSGATEPVGIVELTLGGGARLSRGTAMLLRVIESQNN